MAAAASAVTKQAINWRTEMILVKTILATLLGMLIGKWIGDMVSDYNIVVLICAIGVGAALGISTYKHAKKQAQNPK